MDRPYLPGANSGYSLNPTGIPQQGLRGPGADMAGQKSYFGNASSDTSFRGNERGKSKASEHLSRSGVNTELGDGSKRKATDGCKVDKEVRADSEVKFENVKLEEANKREPVVKSSAGNARQKRRKMVVESSSSETIDSDEIIIEGGHPAEQNVGTTGSYPRRLTRQKQNVSYNEDVTGDDDFVTPLKSLRNGGTPSNANRSDKASSEADPDVIDIRTTETAFSVDKKDDKQDGIPSAENLPNGRQKKEQLTGEREGSLSNGSGSKANPSVGSRQKSSIDPDFISYPDPEFFDFEKERDPSKFALDQIWSVYDDLDGMPRFYARILNVYGPKFKLRFTWLEHDPMGKAEMQWSEEDLHAACGNFRLGKSEYTEEHLMFSHLMPWRKGTSRNSYEICPRKGEVWALFKDWDIRCISDKDHHRPLEYEAVEILSDYVESAEITAVRLVKINGFVSLFMRAVDKEMALPLEIPRSELLRFSHKIPSYRMNGEEREGISAGPFELDSAALPINFEKTCPSLGLESTEVRVEELPSKPASGEEKPSASTTKMKEKNAHENRRSRDQSTNGLNRACEKEQNRASTSRRSASEARGHVETETMTAEHQVDEKVEIVDERAPSTNSAVHSAGTVYEYPESEFHNFEESRTCGKLERGQIWALYSDIDRFPNLYGRIKRVYTKIFKVHVTWLEVCSAGEEEKRLFDEELPVSCGTFKIVQETTIFDTTGTFSHLVQAAPEGRGDHYAIYPSAGEVWALYKNWSAGWSSSDLENCEYGVVEIVDRSDSRTRVLVLTKVSGCRAVFMSGRSTVEVPAGEYLRFSHQIPAFRLTDERGGRLRGCWELDPASVPEEHQNLFPVHSAGAEHQVDEKVEIVDERAPSTNSAVHSAGAVYEYPESEFHNFEESRTCGKFERGQIWALYSDIDRFPNLYGRIKRVYTNVFKVHVRWLQVCSAGEEVRRWFDEELPVSCGTFKSVQETTIFDSTDTFSHLVQAAPEGRRDHYAIYPSTGEVWALFKKWSAKWSSSDLENCEYDVVEIVDRSDSGTRVLVLTKVSGCRAVFMSGRSTVEIAAGEYLRFSHQIPAFRLTDERGGRRRGYWELDPASVPEKLL